MKDGFFLRVQGVVRGPFTLNQLQTLLSRGQLQRFHEISSDKKKWIAAGSVVELFPAATVSVSEQSHLSASARTPTTTPDRSKNTPRSRLLKVWRFLSIFAIVAIVIAGGVHLLLKFNPADARRTDEVDAKRAVQILKTHCYECHGHGRKGTNKKFDVLDREVLVREIAGRPKLNFLTPGDLERSAIWKRIENDDMPDTDTKLTREEKEIVKKWILGGAEFSESPSSPPTVKVTNRQVAEMIDSVLNKTLEQTERRNTRFFVLHQLHNRGSGLKDLRLYRAALSKLLNSLSKRKEIAHPIPIDPDGLVLQINLLDYGWDESKWAALVKGYKYHFDEDAGLSERIRQQSGVDVYAIRADWFIASASKPPLYHDLLGIPNNVAALEKGLDVRRIQNIQQKQVIRAGFGAGRSGVSAQNRVIERHSGYYWISYDFQKENPRNDIMAFPLGPLAANLSPPDQPGLHFVADGGEIIFALPNELQGYMLINASGARINEGPSAVVSDPKDSSGAGFVITNGLSCFACHRHGLVEKFDEVQEKTGVKGNAKSRVAGLYRSKDELAGVFKKDNDKFLAALQECYRPFFTPDEAKKEKEPIVYCHKEYTRPLDFKKASCELEVTDERLRHAAESGGVFLVGSLGALRNGTMEREVWERIFPLVVRELQLGRPARD